MLRQSGRCDSRLVLRAIDQTDSDIVDKVGGVELCDIHERVIVDRLASFHDVIAQCEGGVGIKGGVEEGYIAGIKGENGAVESIDDGFARVEGGGLESDWDRHFGGELVVV